MNPKRIIEPVLEPVTVDELKEQCRVDTDDEVLLLGRKIAEARAWCEHVCRRTFLTSTWELRRDRFADVIELARPPIQSVASVTYLDDDGVEQTVDPSTYELDAYSEPGLLLLAPNASWPEPADRHHAVRVRYVAGWEAPEDLPPDLREQVALLAAQAFAHREPIVVGTIVAGLPFGLMAKLWPHRVLSLG